VKVMIVGENGQLGKTLMHTAPSTVTAFALDIPDFDITDGDQVNQTVEAERPAAIVNASAYTAVDRAEQEADLAFRVNATGPQHLALAAKK
jgi:dTDP-4-dehydrorhamnose reductase